MLGSEIMSDDVVSFYAILEESIMILFGFSMFPNPPVVDSSIEGIVV